MEDCSAFLQTVEEFCSLIENAESFHRTRFAALCFRLVSKLLTQVSELPDVPLLARIHIVGDEDYNKIVTVLKSLLGDKDYYRMVFDPFSEDGEAIYGSLSDDLSDIWRDLNGGLEAYRSGRVEEAVGEWRFSFAYHWGLHHATHVLKPLLSVMLEGGWYEHEE
jgi:hypothetical protein